MGCCGIFIWHMQFIFSSVPMWYFDKSPWIWKPWKKQIIQRRSAATHLLRPGSTWCKAKCCSGLMSRTWTDPLTSYFSETPLQKNNSISHLFTTRDNQKLLSLSGKSIVIIIKKYAAKPHRKEEEKEEDLSVTLAKAVSPRESFPPGMRGKWSPGAFIVSGWCVF